MSAGINQNQSHSLPERDELGRMNEFALYKLMSLCEKTMQTIEAKNKKGNDNWVFFNDMWSALGQAIIQLQQEDYLKSKIVWYSELSEVLAKKVQSLEQELAGYKVLERMAVTHTDEAWREEVKKVHRRMKMLTEMKEGNHEINAATQSKNGTDQ